MTGEPVLVTAEWALYASNGGPDGPQLLASSLGRFGSSDFEALLATSVQVIPPGQLEVTVASLVGPGTGDYLGLVIHNTPSLGGHGLANDHMLTACFCLPWEQLAAGPVP